MLNDYRKLIDVIIHKNNEFKHLPAISRMILQFQKKWFKQLNREKDLEYLSRCELINIAFENLQEKLNQKN
jgi:hypothetical protein